MTPKMSPLLAALAVNAGLVLACQGSGGAAGVDAGAAAAPVAVTACSGPDVDLAKAMADPLCRATGAPPTAPPDGLLASLRAPGPVKSGAETQLELTLRNDRVVPLVFVLSLPPRADCPAPWDLTRGISFGSLASIGTGAIGTASLDTESPRRRKQDRGAAPPPAVAEPQRPPAPDPQPLPCGFAVVTRVASGAEVLYVPPSLPGEAGIASLFGPPPPEAPRLVRIELAPGGVAKLPIPWMAVGYAPGTAPLAGGSMPALPPGKVRVEVAVPLAGASTPPRGDVEVTVVAGAP